MYNLRFFFTCFLSLLIVWNTSAQILNIDRVVNDSLSKNWYSLISGTLSYDKQKRNVSDFSAYSEFVMKRKNNYGLVYIGQYDGTLAQRDFIQNQGFFQVRYRDLDTRTKSVEVFVQYQWNGIWGMESRQLAGGNFRRRLFVNKNADGFLGLGAFYQHERWNYSGVETIDPVLLPAGKVYDNGVRSNLYLKVARKIFRDCDVVLQHVVQTNVKDIASNPGFRWFFQGEVTYDANRFLQLTFAYNHMYNQRPVVPIRNMYFDYSMSVNVRF